MHLVLYNIYLYCTRALRNLVLRELITLYLSNKQRFTRQGVVFKAVYSGEFCVILSPPRLTHKRIEQEAAHVYVRNLYVYISSGHLHLIFIVPRRVHTLPQSCADAHVATVCVYTRRYARILYARREIMAEDADDDPWRGGCGAVNREQF